MIHSQQWLRDCRRICRGNDGRAARICRGDGSSSCLVNWFVGSVNWFALLNERPGPIAVGRNCSLELPDASWDVWESQESVKRVSAGGGQECLIGEEEGSGESRDKCGDVDSWKSLRILRIPGEWGECCRWLALGELVTVGQCCRFFPNFYFCCCCRFFGNNQPMVPAISEMIFPMAVDVTWNLVSWFVMSVGKDAGWLSEWGSGEGKLCRNRATSSAASGAASTDGVRRESRSVSRSVSAADDGRVDIPVRFCLASGASVTLKWRIFRSVWTGVNHGSSSASPQRVSDGTAASLTIGHVNGTGIGMSSEWMIAVTVKHLEESQSIPKEGSGEVENWLKLGGSPLLDVERWPIGIASIVRSGKPFKVANRTRLTLVATMCTQLSNKHPLVSHPINFINVMDCPPNRKCEAEKIRQQQKKDWTKSCTKKRTLLKNTPSCNL